MAQTENQESQITDQDRAEFSESVPKNGVSGYNLIAIAIIVLAALAIIWQLVITPMFISKEEPKKQKVEESTAASPQPLNVGEFVEPEPEKPAPEAKPEPEPEPQVTICANGLKLPAGMPCPNTQPQATGQASSKKKKVDPILARKLKGTIAAPKFKASVGQEASDPQVAFFGDDSGLNTQSTKTEGNGLSDTIPEIYTPKAQASILTNPSLTLVKGTLPDCTLAVRIKSSLSGFVSCKLSMPVYSADGRVVLMEAGTVFEGEYRASFKAGHTSLQTIMTRARTPHNVIIPLNSLATDSLGTAGLAGQVDNKWMQRFGGAIVTALIEDGVEIYQARQTASGNDNIITQLDQTGSSTEAITEEFLKQGSQVKPEIVVNQGAIVKVYVARDIDFSHVYKLEMN